VLRRRRSAEPIDVLVVCTGNMCRSPIIASLLSAAVPSLVVRSAGTGAPRNTPWHPLAIEALAEVGLDVTGTARQLTAADVRAARLVLTGEGIHRAKAIELDPTAENRTFTLLEAARLLRTSPAAEGIGPEALAEHLTEALKADPSEHDDDLPDPLNGDLEDFRTCRENARSALHALVPVLGANG
jgi:protein-tyrosine phosphatase